MLACQIPNSGTGEINITIGTLIVMIFFSIMIYYIFLIIIEPIRLTKNNRWYYYYVVPVTLLLGFWLFFIFISFQIFKALEYDIDLIFYVGLFFPALFIWFFACTSYYKTLRLLEETIKFRKQYPLKEVRK